MLSFIFTISTHICPPDDAFLLSEPHVTAMFQCLEAVEQNNPKLLAQVDTVGVGLVKELDDKSTSACGSLLTFFSRLPAVPIEEPNSSGPAEEPESVCVAGGWRGLEEL